MKINFGKNFLGRLALCKEALMCRHYALVGTTSDTNPIEWQYGAIARLKQNEKIDEFLYGGYSTLCLGYIGLYEVTKLVKGVSYLEEEGHEFAIKLIKYLKKTTRKWQNETNIGFSLYSTPDRNLGHIFAKLDKEKFGTIKDITDKDYLEGYTIDKNEKIDIFDRIKIESEFQQIQRGGAISYIDTPKEPKQIEELIKFVYDNIQYVEFK